MILDNAGASAPAILTAPAPVGETHEDLANAQNLSTPIDGLTQSQVAERKAAGLSNAFHPATSRSYAQIIWQHAFSFINIVLFGLGITLVAMGRIDDAILTAGMVFLNVVIGVSQEGRAKHKLDQIALLNRPKATVVREGREQTLDPSEIVLGDVLQVRAGDQVVVDGQVISSDGMEADESLLTGESDRVPKHVGDQIYSGSFCTVGTARFIATKVGATSFANQLTVGARAYRLIRTPLQRDVNYIVRLLVLMATELGVLITLSFLYSPVPMVQRVQIAAVIAALVPQGLFAMVTVTYAMGALRMAGKGALIQQINAVESLSNVKILCLDKTGTLTTNSLKVEDSYPVGISKDDLSHALGDFLASLPDANRTSEALGEVFIGQARQVREQIPFSSARKWSAASFDEDALRGVYVLGALEMLQHALSPSTDMDALLKQVNAWSDRGLRVLLFARSPQVAPLHDDQGEPKLPADLTPMALISLRDELRPEAQATLRAFAQAGVNIKVISGDNPQTVAALARQAGLEGDIKAISGLDLAKMNDEEFARAAEEGVIFGRITPQQKEQLVRALKAKGHYVGMIGDGVNDVLSLKQAHLAIAMQSGSQATRGVADIVLLSDSFAVLPRAVLEGQRIIRGMQDVMRLMLTHTLAVALLIVGCAIIEVAFPTTPKLRTVWTLLTVGFPTLAIATWAKPGPPPPSLVKPVIHFVVPAAFMMSTVTLGVYLTYLLSTGNADLSRSALTTTGVLCGLMLIPFVEPPTPFWVGGDELSGDWRPTILGILLLVVYVVVLIVPTFRDFFQLTPLPFLDLLGIGALVLAWALVLRFVWRYRLFERIITPEHA